MKTGVKLGRDAMAAIGAQLRLMYADIVAEGVPQRLAEILRRLDQPGSQDEPVSFPHLGGEQRRALALLLNAPRGLTEATLLRVHGFTFELLTSLVHLRLAEVATGTARAGGRTVEVTRIKITNAGRRAIGGAEGEWE